MDVTLAKPRNETVFLLGTCKLEMDAVVLALSLIKLTFLKVLKPHLQPTLCVFWVKKSINRAKTTLRFFNQINFVLRRTDLVSRITNHQKDRKHNHKSNIFHIYLRYKIITSYTL